MSRQESLPFKGSEYVNLNTSANYNRGTTNAVVGTITNVSSGGNYTYTNGTTININDVNSASPYPSAINVSGTTGNISKVTATLKGLGHTYPDDIDILLAGPNGQKVLLMSDAGGSNDLSNVNLTFDQSATATLPDENQIVAGTYRPSNYNTTTGDTDTFAAPAPAGPYGTNLGVFNGTNPNGTWNLFVRDDLAGDVGAIATGWQLNIQTA